jgi:phospholipid/cholesterol/gamma-HCH transport system substrate-binding protein
MTRGVGGTAWRLTVFLAVCALALFALLAVFAQLRFDGAQIYRAEFTNVTGLEAGNFVRIAGVEVGKVKNIQLRDDSTAVVELAVDNSVVLTLGTRAEIRWENLIGGRFLALEEGPGSPYRLNPGDVIPLARTSPALDLDALIGGFRPLFRALDPDQVNALTAELVSAFQDQGATIGSLLQQTAALTDTLANHDGLIGQVIDNLNAVIGSFSDQRQQFGKAIDSLSQLVHGLAERKTDVSNSVAYANAAAAGFADLLGQTRPALHDLINQTDRTSSIINADHDYVDNLLSTLPDAYRMLSRLGLYGDYFSFYLCDIVLKVNGKGGQPVYIKVASQDTGRCEPKK